MIQKRTLGEKIFDIFNIIFLTLLVIITLYPCAYVLFASLSDPSEVAKAHGLLFYPKGFQIKSYVLAFQNPNIIPGYKNTLLYVSVGTLTNIILTLFAAYALSRKSLYGRNVFMLMIVFTMFFSGGLIPQFIVNKNLGFYNNLWAMVIPFAINTFNLIILRTFFLTVPDSMEESAKMDGANDFTILFKIMFPLALPSIAVVTLYYGVENWNTYMRGLIYLSSRSRYPLQLVLREILIQNASSASDYVVSEVSENMKYATIVIATVPILLVYPFLQKYFVKGVMIGAVKG